MDPLTQEIILANTGTACLDALVRQLQLLIYQKLRGMWRLSLENAHMVVDGFSPQLPGLIQNFQYTGKPFTAYLLTHLKFFIRKSLQRLWADYKTRQVLESSLDEATACEAVSPTSRAEYPDPIEGVPDRQNALSSNRLLYLLLRSAWSVDDTLLERAALYLSKPKKDLDAMVSRARTSLLGRYALRRRLYERRSNFLHQIFLLQHQSRNAADEALEARCAQSEARLREHIANLDRRLARLCMVPTHAVIGEILCLNRSSVGSLASRLKQSTLAGLLTCLDRQR